MQHQLAALAKKLTSPAVIYLVALVLSRAGAIFLIPLYTRHLSQADYGALALAGTVVALVPTFASLSLTTAIQKFYFTERGESKSACVCNWTALSCLVFGLVLQALILWVAQTSASGLYSRSGASLVLWASIGSALTQIPSTFLRAKQRALAASGFPLIQFFASCAMGYYLVSVQQRGLQGAIEALFVSNALTGLAALIFVVSIRGSWSTLVLREALRFSLPFIPQVAANQLQGVFDRWALEGTGLKDELGRFALATQLMAPASMMVSAYNDATAPKFGAAFQGEGEKGLHHLVRSFEIKYALAGLVPSVVIALAVPLVAHIPLSPPLIDVKFYPAFGLLPVLAFTAVIDALYYPPINILFFAGKSTLIFYATLASGVLNVVLNLVLVTRWGLSGILVARVGSVAARTLLMRWFASRTA
jgi:O-antigen/teichoic acid export membrane protein